MNCLQKSEFQNCRNHEDRNTVDEELIQWGFLYGYSLKLLLLKRTKLCLLEKMNMNKTFFNFQAICTLILAFSTRRTNKILHVLNGRPGLISYVFYSTVKTFKISLSVPVI